MKRRDRPRRTRLRVWASGAGVLAVAAVLATTGGAGVPARADSPRASVQIDLDDRHWIWPVSRFRLDEGYHAPASRYAPGHRGIDIRPVDGFDVRAPAAGVVAFSGSVAGRGILTIDHGDGLVTTLEPVESPLLAGDRVERAALVGTVSVGGHTAAGALHFGVRLNGEYINPQLLLGGVPRAVLLPCC